MLMFLDMILTDQGPQPKLISLAMVSDAGHQFYVESAQIDRGKCSSTLQDFVLARLGRVPGATSASKDIPGRLRQWFEGLPEPATIVCETARDWDRLVQLTLTGGEQFKPRNLSQAWVLDMEIVRSPAYAAGWLGVAGDTDADVRPGLHALTGAKALHSGFLRWAGVGNSVSTS